MKRKFNVLIPITTLLFTVGVVKAQVSTPFNFGFPANYVGWNAAQAFPLTIAHKGNQPLNFQTNGTQRMTILNTTGFVGIGGGFLNPLHLVDVRNGNINIGQGTGANIAGSPQSYMIGGQNILWHNGEVRNLFVGVAAGANTAGALAFENTFIGSRAGFSNTTGQRNTFMGANAGENATTGRFNTFIGTEAGRFFIIGDHNTFVGEQAGDRQLSGTNNSYFGAHTVTGPFVANGIGNNNTILGAFAGADIINGNANTFTGVNSGGNCNSGSFNTFTGNASGSQCTSGLRNTMNGFASGLFTSTGNDNVFMGQRAGFFNSTGSNNTYIGVNTGFPTFGLALAGNTATNSAALGNGAQIRRSDVMILGNNDVNVGIGLSNDITTAQGPQNKLEIDAGVAGLNPSPSGAPGTSGLRFRDLHSGNTTVTNPGTGVLSVDASGDVIYVPANSGSGIGNYCTAPTQNSLTGDYEIPMNLNNYYFSGNNTTKERVAVGLACGSTLPSKFNVLLDKTFTANFVVGNNAGYFRNINIGAAHNVGVKGEVTAGPGENSGGYFIANSTNATAGNVGVRAIAANGNDAFGVSSSAQNGAIWSVAGKFDVINSTSPQNYGINSNVVGGTIANSVNYGGSFYNANVGATNFGVLATAFNAGTNYAIFGSVSGSSSTTPPSGPDYAGYFNGDVVRTGTDNFTSDFNLKQNIDTIVNATAIINQLKPKTFEYKQSSFPSMNLPSGKQYGLIAQDVQSVLPELVNNNVHPAKLDSVGNIVIPAVNYLSLEYQQLIGIILKGMQEQQAKIDSLTAKLNSKDSIQDARLTALENAIAACCSNASVRSNNNTIQTTLNQLDVELSDKDAIILNQNVPNPFAEQTTITYNVPASVGKAQIIFFNNLGQIIQTVDIKTRGKGKVNVFASDLSSGLYNYTLVADGKVIDSKKMVRE